MGRAALSSFLLLSFALASAACAAGDGERAADLVHALLLAGAQPGQLSRLESFPGELPEDLPVELPEYPGADLVVSSRQPIASGGAALGGDEGEQGGGPDTILYFIIFETDASRTRVFDFYEEALDEDPWQVDSTASSRELDTLQFSNEDDADIAGILAIVPGAEGERTSILISLQDAGAEIEEEPPFELGASVPVPQGFPPEVPRYRGSTTTDSAFFREPDLESFLLVFLTRDSQEEAIAFYRRAFEELGWTVEEGEPTSLESRITFADDAGDVQGEVTADRFSEDREFTQVTIRMQVNPAHEPPADGEDEDAEPAPSEEEPRETPARETPQQNEPGGTS